MSAENKSQCGAQRPASSQRKAVTKPLNLTKRAEEVEQAEAAPGKSKRKEQKLVPPPQPIPDNGSVPQDEVLNKDQT